MSGEGGPLPDRPTRMETAPGIFVDLDLASRDAAVAALGQSEAPIALADELVAAVTGAALKAVVLARVRLIIAGHSAENDDDLPVAMLPMMAKKRLAVARDALHGGCCDADDLAGARAALAETAALAMAAIDRIDRAAAQGER